LVAAGLVVRARHPGDGRSSYAQLTDAGVAAYRRAAPVYVRAIRARLGELMAPQEAALVRAVLERVLSG
jgi:DNA-binding MarR family transcriptional regulator